uniref:Serine protease n=1 Tax=Kofsystermes virus TaxID=2796604 RepID=A0A7T7GVG3_9VIRU|nr:hypothetical protein [Kofsystermes virus]
MAVSLIVQIVLVTAAVFWRIISFLLVGQTLLETLYRVIYVATLILVLYTSFFLVRWAWWFAVMLYRGFKIILWILSKLQPPELVPEATHCRCRWEPPPRSPWEMKNESLMPNSPFIDLRPPPGQYPVLQGDRMVGNCLRIGSHLVMPEHVYMVGNLTIRVVSDGEYDYEVDSLVWKPVVDTTDVVYAPLPVGFRGPSLKTAPAMEGLAQVANAHGRMSGSLGMLSTRAFDLLYYEGSTAAGFSGSAYMQGGRAVGMHLSGCSAFNAGVPLEMIRIRLAKAESSEFLALQDALNRVREKDLEFRNTGDPDVVEVKHRGRYYRVSRDEFEQLDTRENRKRQRMEEDLAEERMFGRDWGGLLDREGTRRDRRELNRMMRNECADPTAPPAPPTSQPDLYPSLPATDVDPLPEYSGNLMCPMETSGYYNGQVSGNCAPRDNRTAPPTVSQSKETSSDLAMKLVEVLSGLVPTTVPSCGPCSSTQNGEQWQKVKSKSRHRSRKNSSSKPSSGATPSDTTSRLTPSIPKPAKRGSTSASAPSTSAQAQA